jgi:DUF1016 N-terminal domain/YhcG PDDEXK nuclease domain
MAPRKSTSIYNRVRQILESARASAARSVNTSQVMAYWLIGQEIVEEQQRGQRRADYGARLLKELSSRLHTDFGKGFSVNNLEHFRDFYLTYPDLIPRAKSHALRVKLTNDSETGVSEISHALRGEFRKGASWKPGGKLTHQDLGQLQLYVNYYDRERLTEGDNPTLGLILCADKNDAVVKYTLGPEQEKKIFASRYKLHLPTEAELKAKIRRELRMIQNAENKT